MSRRNRAPLTREEKLEVVIAYLGNVPVKKIEEHYAISRMTVYKILNQFDIERNRRPEPCSK